MGYRDQRTELHSREFNLTWSSHFSSESIIIITSLCDHGNHGVARHLVADCLVNNNEIRIFKFKNRAEIYFLFSFYVHNVVRETCPYRAELLTDFDGVQQ